MNVLRKGLAAAGAAGIFGRAQVAAITELVEFHEGCDVPDEFAGAFAELMAEAPEQAAGKESGKPEPTADELKVALRMAHYELLTLHPRLGDPYRKSVRAVLDEMTKVWKPDY